MKEYPMQLGCASQQNTEVSFEYVIPRRVLEYKLHEIMITRPPRGSIKQRVVCPTCNTDVFIRIRSFRSTLLIRLTAIILLIIPIAVLAGFFLLKLPKNSPLLGLLAVLFLAPLCLVPVFLPKLFRREDQLAFVVKKPRDLSHRLFEANVESVRSEVYF